MQMPRRALTEAQRTWCENTVGKYIQWHPERSTKALVLDYKSDTAGKGAFFIVEKASRELLEVYRLFPPRIAS
jgi:hypothetical protein